MRPRTDVLESLPSNGRSVISAAFFFMSIPQLKHP
jgi:hypothetical protein